MKEYVLVCAPLSRRYVQDLNNDVNNMGLDKATLVE
jgi:hypothetical protein